MFDKTKIGTKKDLKPYFVEDWEQTIYIKKINGRDMELIEQLAKEGETSNIDGYIVHIILAVCDERGKPIFNVEEDFDLLKDETIDVLNKIVRQIQEHNKFDNEELKKK